MKEAKGKPFEDIKRGVLKTSHHPSASTTPLRLNRGASDRQLNRKQLRQAIDCKLPSKRKRRSFDKAKQQQHTNNRQPPTQLRPAERIAGRSNKFSILKSSSDKVNSIVGGFHQRQVQWIKSEAFPSRKEAHHEYKEAC